MNIPTELWHLIIECYDIKTYKRCILVNKLFNKIVKKIIDSIPDKIMIEFHTTQDKVRCVKCGNYEHGYCEPINDTNPQELWQDSILWGNVHGNVLTPSSYPKFEISKRDLLYFNRVYIFNFREYIPLPIELVLKNKNSIIYMKYIIWTNLAGDHTWFHYCDKIL